MVIDFVIAAIGRRTLLLRVLGGGVRGLLEVMMMMTLFPLVLVGGGGSSSKD